MNTIDLALAVATEGIRDRHGRPVAGKLQTAWITPADGEWEAVAVYRFVTPWTVCRGPDPVVCLRTVLEKGPIATAYVDLLDTPSPGPSSRG